MSGENFRQEKFQQNVFDRKICSPGCKMPAQYFRQKILLSINSIQFRYDKQLARYIAGEYFHRRLFPWNVCEGVLHLDEVVKSEGSSKNESEDDHAVAHIPRFLRR